MYDSRLKTLMIERPLRITHLLKRHRRAIMTFNRRMKNQRHIIIGVLIGLLIPLFYLFTVWFLDRFKIYFSLPDEIIYWPVTLVVALKKTEIFYFGNGSQLNGDAQEMAAFSKMLIWTFLWYGIAGGLISHGLWKVKHRSKREEHGTETV
jgi:hypothetical protein